MSAGKANRTFKLPKSVFRHKEAHKRPVCACCGVRAPYSASSKPVFNRNAQVWGEKFGHRCPHWEPCVGIDGSSSGCAKCRARDPNVVIEIMPAHIGGKNTGMGPEEAENPVPELHLGLSGRHRESARPGHSLPEWFAMRVGNV